MDYKFKDKKWAVLGYGLEGVDAIDYLINKGVKKVTVFDKKDLSQLRVNEFHSRICDFITGESYLDKGIKGFDYIVRSPGFYRHLPQIIDAEKLGSVITSSTKMFFELFKGKIIGVTGTKGKGTTSTLIYEILKSSGFEVVLLGNIGKPLLGNINKLSKKTWAVLELSSFQLIDLEKSPYISVILNMTTDHLDWHKNREEYVNAKKNIVSHQKSTDLSVVNIDYPTSESFTKIGDSKKYGFSLKNKTHGCFIENDRLKINLHRKIITLGNLNSLLLRGKHNWENVSAAALTSYLVGVPVKDIMKIIYNFRGLEHRLEFVSEIDRVKYYDDSFSTNPQTTLAAVNSFDEPITIILGGFDKGLRYALMAKEFVKKKNIENIILIGDISDHIKVELDKKKYSGNLIVMGYPDMTDIVEKCAQLTKPGGVVILSPASSSFDMFVDYKDRGNRFKMAVLDMLQTIHN